ncbi:cell division FtsA domain-containing protein, partial [Alphaproteobacteria bacterium]|nr:cell division FtsA domain-containing protein [Alphaproteobacteria bacterium]
VWEEFGNNIKNKIEHDYIKKIVISRLDEIFNLIFKILPEDKNFYSYLFTGGGAKMKNFQLYFRSKFGQDIQILEPPSSSGIPKVLNDSSFMSIYCAYWLQSHKTTEKEDFLKKIDSFSNKIWYKRFVDLL